MMQIINIPNSMTVLPELLPYSIEMVGAHWPFLCAASLGIGSANIYLVDIITGKSRDAALCIDGVMRAL